MHTILASGAAGFIASHVIDAILASADALRDDVEILALDSLDPQVHPSGDWPAYLTTDKRVRRIKADLRRRNGPLVHVLQQYQPRTVIHLAAKVGVGQSATRPYDYVEANALGTARLLEALQQGAWRPEKLIVASSMSCYGEGAYWDPKSPGSRQRRPFAGARPSPVSELDELQPTSIYAETKATTERLSLLWGTAQGVPTFALRFFNVWGPRQALTNPYTGVAAIFLSAALRGEAPQIYEDGLQSRDFVHVCDVAQAISDLALNNARLDESGPYNVCTGVATTILDLAEELCAYAGTDVRPVIRGDTRVGDIRHCIGDPTALRRILEARGSEWRPRPFGGQEELDKLVAWAKAQDDVKPIGDAHAEMLFEGLIREFLGE